MKNILLIFTMVFVLTACQSEGSSKEVDLNGDGNSDVLGWTIEESGLYTLSVNEASLTSSGTNLEGTYKIVDIDTTDAYKEIAVGDFGASDDYATEFFYYDGQTIRSMGMVEGLLDDMVLDGKGGLITQVRGKILDTWFHKGSYSLGEYRQLVYVPEALYERNTPVVLLQDFTPQKSPEDASVAFTLQKGDYAAIVSCDDIKWCSIQNSEGETAWFAVEAFNQIVGTEFYSGELFEGLSFAD